MYAVSGGQGLHLRCAPVAGLVQVQPQVNELAQPNWHGCLCLQVHPELQSSFWGSVHVAGILQTDGLAGSALKLLASCNLLFWEG